jgi:Tfp pilus assembly protein PilO
MKKDMVLRLGIGGGMLAILIGLTLAIGADMSDRTANIASLQTELATRASSVERLLRLRTQADQAVSYRNALNDLLPKPEELVALPREIRGIAAAEGVTVSNVTLGAETTSTNAEPGSIDVQFSVTGALASFTSFLQALEERTGFIAFSSIDAPITNRVNASVKAKAFSR